ncbi:MAG: selenide, water dikinase SelD [Anaerolineae bacterium]
MLRPLSETFKAADFPSLLVGLQAPDDAAVYQVGDSQAIIATVDFFPPVVDDPYAFGYIAAANAMSDVYAMGGDVLFAINLAAFPDNLDTAILSEILRGGAEAVREAGAVVAGGHTIKDKEPKFGLAVTGMVDPKKIITKGGAQVGDALILTKPLGSGVITTALKREIADAAHVSAAIASMMRLNRGAAQAAQAVGVHAMTDITGYSLIGHAHEMAHLSGVNFVFDFDALPFLAGAIGYAQANTFPGGAGNNREFYGPWTTFDPSIGEEMQMLAYDPQTSGGLLVAVSEAKAALLIAEMAKRGVIGTRIGRVTSGDGRLSFERSR